MAQGWALLANINRDTKRRSQPFEVYDFMPFHPKPEKPEKQITSQAQWRSLLRG
jgi:hypothetical protein